MSFEAPPFKDVGIGTYFWLDIPSFLFSSHILYSTFNIPSSPLPFSHPFLYHCPVMLTFSALSPTSLRISSGSSTIIAFPESSPKALKENDIFLLAIPEEQFRVQVISWPGEYNVNGISILGIEHSGGKQASYVATVDGVRIGFLSLPLKDWTDQQIESVGDIDVLVLPASETKLCQKLIDEFDPRVLLVLPGTEKGALSALEKVIGAKRTESEFKLKGALPAEGREVIVLA
jgi:hypothetical protein